MCSNLTARIDQICGAIEELADRSGQRDGAAAAAAASAGTDGSGGTSGARETGTGAAGRAAGAPAAVDDNGAQAGDDVAERLAAIWAMIADADPELARRLPGYLSAAD